MLDRRKFLIGSAVTLAAGATHALSQESSAPVHVRVTEQQLGQLPAMGLGFSMEKDVLGRPDFFTPENTDFVGCCRRLGPNILRMGGNHVDMGEGWQPNGPGGIQTMTSPKDVARFAAFVKAIGWKAVYGINLAHNTPAAAASEAAAAANALGPSLLALEIGNEPNLYIFHKYRPDTYRYPQFLNEWRTLAQAIRAAVPGVPLTGPGAAAHGAKNFALPFARDEGHNILLLTQHYYRANGRKPGATVDALFGGLPALYDMMAELVAAARRGGVAQGFRMIETNSFAGGGSPGVSNSMASALWAIDYVLRAAELGVNGLNFQIGGNRSFNTSLAMGRGKVDNIRPEFYALALLSALGTGAMLKNKVTGAPSGLSAFSLRGESHLSVVINNKNAADSADIEISSGTHSSDAKLIRLTAPSLQSKTNIQLGGATIATDGSGQPKPEQMQAAQPGIFRITVPPASAAWLQLSS